MFSVENAVTEFPPRRAPLLCCGQLCVLHRRRWEGANTFAASFEEWPYPTGKAQGQGWSGSCGALVRGSKVPRKPWICPPRARMDGLASTTCYPRDSGQVSESLCTSKMENHESLSFINFWFCVHVWGWNEIVDGKAFCKMGSRWLPSLQRRLVWATATVSPAHVGNPYCFSWTLDCILYVFYSYYT